MAEGTPNPPEARGIVEGDIPKGATISAAYGKREVKTYPVLENEFDNLSSLNTLAIVFFSVGSFLLSAAIGVWVNAVFNVQLTPAGEVASKWVAPGVLVLSVVFYALGLWANHRGASTWQKIKRETK
jgi:hypothetical protein